MDAVVVAGVAIVVGIPVAAFGTRLFYLLAPVWGFLTGLVVGADVAASATGDPLFGTLGSWVAGAVLGLVLAAVAGVWFNGAVLALGTGMGFAVVCGLLAALGLEPSALTMAAGIAAGVALGLAVIAADGASTLVAALTGYGGATWVTTGVLLLIGRIQTADLHAVGAAGAMRGDVPALGAAFLLGTLAFVYQRLDLGARRVTALRRDGYRF